MKYEIKFRETHMNEMLKFPISKYEREKFISYMQI